VNTIKCSQEGCEAVFKTNEPLSPGAKYTCREHTGKAANDVRFQNYQFDKVLDGK